MADLNLSLNSLVQNISCSFNGLFPFPRAVLLDIDFQSLIYDFQVYSQTINQDHMITELNFLEYLQLNVYMSILLANIFLFSCNWILRSY